jgi:hypothetical protein
MKFYVYHQTGEELHVPGVYQEGTPRYRNGRKPHWIDIPEDQLGAKLLELSKTYDVMLMSPEEVKKYYPQTAETTHHRLYLDYKGGRFRTR